MIAHPCGCTNEVHRPSGVLRSASKCDAHRAEARDPTTLGLAYYEELGAIAGGVPGCRRYLDQLVEALGEFPGPGDRIGDDALEVGCGASMYAAGLIRAGYRYCGVEPSPWGAAWTRETYLVPVLQCDFEAIDRDAFAGRFALVLAAHVVEHLNDAPGAIRECAAMLRPGGELWIVVPDDSDPVNADHLWFFDARTLRACLEAAGLVVVAVAERRHVARERFLYARARTP